MLVQLDPKLMAFHKRFELTSKAISQEPVPTRESGPASSIRRIIDRKLATGHVEVAALFLNAANHSAEVRAIFGDDMIVPYLLMFIHVFSPHRFLESADMLATVTPIHARLMQCLRQYLEVAYASCSLYLPATPSAEFLGPITNPIRPLHVDAVHCSISGEPAPGLASLSQADRQRFLERLDYSQIRAKVPHLIEDFVHVGPGSVPALRVDYRWLFEFCVASLNDPRVDEGSQKDHELQQFITSQFTPILFELVENYSLSSSHSTPS